MPSLEGTESLMANLPAEMLTSGETSHPLKQTQIDGGEEGSAPSLTAVKSRSVS